VPRTYLKLAAAVLASGAAVAACGSVKMGAAAIVGDQRISAAQLSTEVAKYHSKIQQQFPASQTAQQVLGWMVSFQVADRMAQRYGITITPAQQQQALTGITDAVKAQNPGVNLGELAAAIGLPPDLVNDFGRYEAIQTAVLGRLDGGKPPASGSAAAQALTTQFGASQCRAAKSLAIQINPQFGALDYNLNQYAAYSVVPATSALSRGEPSPTPSASPSAPPALNPPC
jgi:folylpolyglutamate synthase/dihydropteroate synthase